MSRALRKTAGAITAATGLLLAGAATGDPIRIHQSANAWYSVSGGKFVYSLFYADKPDGTRDFGADQNADGVFAKVRTTAPPALSRVGVRLEGGTGCFEQRAKNSLGQDGWAYACAFDRAVGEPALAPAPLQVAAVQQTPKAPVKVEAATARPAPVAAAVLVAKAQARAPSPAPAPVAVAAAPAVDPSVALNAKVKAASDAVDARNSAAQSKFEAQKAAFEAEKKAGQDAYAAQLAAHKAEVEAMERKHQAEIEAWQAKVKACKGGDVSQCGN